MQSTETRDNYGRYGALHLWNLANLFFLQILSNSVAVSKGLLRRNVQKALIRLFFRAKILIEKGVLKFPERNVPRSNK